MSRYEDACPFEERSRASRCESCCAGNNNLPPCVAAYLGGRNSIPTNVVALHSIEVGVRKAA